MDKAQQLLTDYGLRKTGCRLDVLRQFLEHDFALSHADLEKKLGSRYDRVTIYRTLYSFEQQGLTHSIKDGSGGLKYALCQHQESLQSKHEDSHIHFSCTGCGQTFCLNDVPVPELMLPQGYEAERLNYSAEGLCKTCSQRNDI
ncbi:Fur family transcriptional regulator [Pontibacter mangrovi]|uniref:Transcriptional repressor n=1 Tax=Pontibacter mangrovi TaxID=2589816 RepID=A0A501WH96_9BACT|nr:transcriptional repressor [Pontibacter mangrovi]TPE44986.1 transcriptional repressor [Pontibacter mangrovi]